MPSTDTVRMPCPAWARAVMQPGAHVASTGRHGIRMVIQVVMNRRDEAHPYYSHLSTHSKRADRTLRSIQIEHAERLIQ